MAPARVIGPTARAAALAVLALAMPHSAPAQQDRSGADRIATLQAEADRGSLAAKLQLGLAYDLGQGVAQDRARAYAWYREAADAGEPDGQFNVAVMLDAGLGVPSRDLAAARRWYTRAAANGQPRAQYALGLMYASGDGVPLNPALSRAWFARAADRLPAARDKLAAPPAPAADVALAPPETRFGTLVAIDRGLFAELGWIAAPGPADTRFVVEVAIWLPELSDWLFPLHAIETDVSGVTIDLKGRDDRYAWRVSRVIPGTDRFAAAPWMALGADDLPLPPADAPPPVSGAAQPPDQTED